MRAALVLEKFGYLYFILLLVVMLIVSAALALPQDKVMAQPASEDSGIVQPVSRDSIDNSTEAQDITPGPARGEGFSNPLAHDAKHFVRGIAFDQKALWTSPLRLRLIDGEWLAPFAGITTGLLMTDRTTSHELTRRNHKQISSELSNAGIGVLGFTAGSMYLLGLRRGDGQLRESGLLSAEAGIDALTVDEALKFAFRRDRPNQDSGTGRFFQSGGASFPSTHAATAFSVATVLANEYPGPMTKLLAYGAATAISFARVTAQQHFPSDVFVGAAMGYWIGRSVYRRNHDPALENYGIFEREPQPISPAQMSSTYIELDSWIYPAVERLAARGVVRSEFLGLRPWTRMAVYQMLDGVYEDDLDPSSAELVGSLKAELKREADLNAGQPNKAISLDRIYTRTQYIAGTPLNDGYHFGQTLVDDFGRPYGQGWQQINGFESRAENGRFSFFVRGEYQHSPDVPGYSASVAQIIANQDRNPVQTYNGLPPRDAFRLLDTYVSMHLLGHEISVGKQSYWWGTDMGSAMMLSDNAEPFYSLRITRTTPLYIPLLSKLLGPFRYDNFFGKLSGHNFPPQPFFYGQKINFSPTENLELGFARDAVIAGEGSTPLTFGNFLTSFTSTSSGTPLNGVAVRNVPGARHGSFDFRYRVPGLRNWLTLYADSVIHDDISPVDAPRHAALTPGIYLARIPGFGKLDLHVEGGTTDPTFSRAKGGQYFYWEGIYRDAYTNKGYLFGSWLGREGTGGRAWLTYWFNPRSTLQLGYRTVKVSHFFVPQGLTQQDAYGQLRYEWKNGLGIQGLIQVERWAAPVLASSPQTDVTTQIQISFSPGSWRKEVR